MTVDQLWRTAISEGGHRVTTASAGDSRSNGSWHVDRTFSVVGRPGHPSMLVEAGPRLGVARSLLAFRALRPPATQASRVALSATARVSPRLSRMVLRLERAEGGDASLEPLSVVERSLGDRLIVHIGIRRGANAKPTLQLFRQSGEPAGYAKLAWSPLTSQFVSTERARLAALDGGNGSARAPRVLHAGTVGDLPFVVTEPLPDSVRRVTRHDGLEPAELIGLTPVHRFGEVSSSGQFRAVTDRLVRRATQPVTASAATRLLEVSRELAASTRRVPIVAYDHGDLAPWNVCRDGDGALWAWDWELSESDTVAGTDAIHWYLHLAHGPDPADLPAALDDALARAQPVLRALGFGHASSRLAAAAYALRLGERAIDLAGHLGTWSRNRVDSEDVEALVRIGLRYVREAGELADA